MDDSNAVLCAGPHELLYHGLRLRKAAAGAPQDVTLLVRVLHACCQKVFSGCDISKNDTLAEIKTPDLPLLLAAAYSGESIYNLDVFGTPENRWDALTDAERRYNLFLERCRDLEIIEKDDYKYLEIMRHKNQGQKNAAMSLAASRELKINRYRSEQDQKKGIISMMKLILNNRVKKTKSISRTENYRVPSFFILHGANIDTEDSMLGACSSSEGSKRTFDSKAEDIDLFSNGKDSNSIVNLMGGLKLSENMDKIDVDVDFGDEDDDDDEEVRSFCLCVIRFWCTKVVNDLLSLEAERQMLKIQIKRLKNKPAEEDQATKELRMLQEAYSNQHGTRKKNDSYSERLDAPRLINDPKKALLDDKGRPLQPFTIVQSRTDFRKQVFRPGHNLPTMTIDEYIDAEIKQGGILPGPSQNVAANSKSKKAHESEENTKNSDSNDDSDEEEIDAKTIKARAWDDYKDDNPRGHGNREGNRG